MNFVILLALITLTEAGVSYNVTAANNVVGAENGMGTTSKNCKLQPKNLTAVLELRDVLYDGLKMIRYNTLPLFLIWLYCSRIHYDTVVASLFCLIYQMWLLSFVFLCFVVIFR